MFYPDCMLLPKSTGGPASPGRPPASPVAGTSAQSSRILGGRPPSWPFPWRAFDRSLPPPPESDAASPGSSPCGFPRNLADAPAAARFFPGAHADQPQHPRPARPGSRCLRNEPGGARREVDPGKTGAPAGRRRFYLCEPPCAPLQDRAAQVEGRSSLGGGTAGVRSGDHGPSHGAAAADRGLGLVEHRWQRPQQGRGGFRGEEDAFRERGSTPMQAPVRPVASNMRRAARKCPEPVVGCQAPRSSRERENPKRPPTIRQFIAHVAGAGRPGELDAAAILGFPD
jgi:hypothetical protein